MKQVYLPEDQVIRRALRALMKSLGPVETARFLNLPRQRRIESVRRHRQWHAIDLLRRMADQRHGFLDVI